MEPLSWACSERTSASLALAPPLRLGSELAEEPWVVVVKGGDEGMSELREAKGTEDDDGALEEGGIEGAGLKDEVRG